MTMRAAAILVVILATASPVAASVSINLGNPQVVADGDSAVSVTVTVTSPYGFPLEGVAVQVDADYYASVSAPPPTDAQGTTTALITTVVEGTYQVYASASGPFGLEEASTQIVAVAPPVASTCVLLTPSADVTLGVGSMTTPRCSWSTVKNPPVAPPAMGGKKFQVMLNIQPPAGGNVGGKWYTDDASGVHSLPQLQLNDMGAWRFTAYLLIWTRGRQVPAGAWLIEKQSVTRTITIQ